MSKSRYIYLLRLLLLSISVISSPLCVAVSVNVSPVASISDTHSIVLFGNMSVPLTNDEVIKRVGAMIERNRREIVARLRARRNIEEWDDTDDTDARFQVTGPRCIPLVSKNVRFNPYHPSLLSRPGAEVRRGLGRPSRFQGVDSIDCTGQAERCRMEIDRGMNVAATDSLTVTSSLGTSSSLMIGETQSQTESDAITRSIARTSENSSQDSNSASNERSLSDSVSNSLSKTLADSTSVSESRSNEERTSNTDETSENHEKNWRVEASTGLFGVGITAGGGHSDSTGKRNSNTKDIGETRSSASERAKVDTVARAAESARSIGSSQANSNTHSNTQTNSYTVNDSATKTKETGHSQTNQREAGSTATNETSKQRSQTLTHTTNIKLSLSVEPNTCRLAVCKPLVLSKIVPYECVSDGGQLLQATSEMSFVVRGSQNSFGCTAALIDCNEGQGGGEYQFRVSDDEFYSSTENSRNSLPFGRLMSVGSRLSSANGNYRLTLMDTGELKLTKHDTSIWSNGLRSLSDYKLRARINDKGHFVVEAGSLKEADEDYERLTANRSAELRCASGSFFSSASKLYKCAEDDWTVVWSSAPVQHAELSIGIGARPGQQLSYKLLLSDTGELRIYDAYAVQLWCTHISCAHNRGYKFPRRYGLPTNMITERVEGDPHNSFSEASLHYTGHELDSIDNDCRQLAANEALISPNKRFVAYLSSSGSLVVRDKHRVMWDSLSSNLKHARAPFKLALSSDGRLLIRDSRQQLIWLSLNSATNATVSPPVQPFKLRLTDEGQFGVIDGANQLLWSVWPSLEIGDMSTVTNSAQLCFKNCETCQEEPLQRNKTPPTTQESPKLASEIPVDQTPRYIVHRDSNKCIGHAADGVVLWTCGAKDQEWRYDHNKGLFRNALDPDKCLVMNDKDYLQLGDCTNRWSRFNFAAHKTSNTLSLIQPRENTNSCLDSDLEVLFKRRVLVKQCSMKKSTQLWHWRLPNIHQLQSHNSEANTLLSNQKLHSNNDKFHFKLTDRGQIQLSDGATLTTANRVHLNESVYKLVLEKDGSLVIIRAENNELVSELVGGQSNLRAPFRLTVDDENGRLMLRDSSDFLYWNTIPTTTNRGSTIIWTWSSSSPTRSCNVCLGR